ncbi:MAG: hypothetical protein V8Q84_08775 [Bilophila sp.]
MGLLDSFEAPAGEGTAFGLADLVTLRQGELVRDDVIGTLTPLEAECVKIAPAPGRATGNAAFCCASRARSRAGRGLRRV